jgi:voltage-gated potassium channel
MTKQQRKSKIHEIIFEADTRAGKIFDEILLVFIFLSVFVVAIDSVPNQSDRLEFFLHSAEWFFTIIFTLEYILRIYVTNRPWKYIFSFYGIIDFLSIIPTYVGIILPQGFAMASIRMIRLVRIFRILKLVQFLGASTLIAESLKKSRYKISVFFISVIILVTIMGSIMYMVEGRGSGFNSIPHSIYWAIVTITTVGYGDIAPATPLGQFIAALVMLTGYAIIAVPTGIITSELAYTRKERIRSNTQVCENCHCESHDNDATYCKKCGTILRQGHHQS